MIDTIILRIHGYEKNNHIVNQLLQITKDDYSIKFIHEDLKSTSSTSILFGDTGRILPVSMRTSLHIPSSHYNISVYPNKARDYIELNLSIPKAEHSTNVLQFIDQHDISVENTFTKMQSFLYRFFNQYFAYPPDWKDIEVNRIDLCYNQIFLSKADALRYMEEQRTLNVANARSDKNRFQAYGTTTVQYHTDNYSFKIYHKGTEFRKNDLSKLLKNNPKKLDISEIADLADRILRYEISCKKGLLNYCFRQKVKDDQNTVFNHHYENISKQRTKNSREFMDKILPNKSFSFRLNSDWEDLSVLSPKLIFNYDLCFNKELFKALHDFFWHRVKTYQLGVKMGIKEIYGKIQDKKDEAELKKSWHGKKEKLAQASQLLLLATLSQYTDISDLKGIIPKATYYRYVKNLENLGIPKHSPDLALAPPPLDYDMYFFYFSKYHQTFN